MTFAELNTLWAIYLILVIIWALGLATWHTLSGLVHIPLVLALVALRVNLIQGRRI